MNKSLALSGLLWLALPVFAGCDPTYGVTASIEIPPDVQALYSVDAPGQVLVHDPLYGFVTRVAVLCDAADAGATLVYPWEHTKYGCTSDPSLLEVWVEPYEVSPADVLTCGLEDDPEAYVEETHDGDEPYGSVPIWTNAHCLPARNLVSDVTVTLSLP
jgi:hypothetical protein